MTVAMVGLPNNQCPYCLKLFRSGYDMKRHQRVHTGEKPFECQQCDKMFARKDNYRLHMLKYHRYYSLLLLIYMFCQNVEGEYGENGQMVVSCNLCVYLECLLFVLVKDMLEKNYKVGICIL